MKTARLTTPYLVWMILFTIVPLGIVIYFALTDSVTGQFTWENIARISNYGPIILKSIWLALLSSLLCLVIGYPVAYHIAQQKPSRQHFLYMLIMLPMCISFLLRTMAWVSLLDDTGIINNFIRALGLKPLPLIRTNAAVVLGMVYNYLPYMILPLYTPAVSTFYISQKLGSSGTTLIGDVIESQFKAAYNPNLGAALSLALMVLVLICIGIMNRFSNGEEVVTL